MTVYRKTNRRDSKETKKKSLFWCSNCDAELIGEVGKCPNCGAHYSRKKQKTKEAYRDVRKEEY